MRSEKLTRNRNVFCKQTCGDVVERSGQKEEFAMFFIATKAIATRLAPFRLTEKSNYKLAMLAKSVLHRLCIAFAL
jgi:hypothetical protein